MHRNLINLYVSAGQWNTLFHSRAADLIYNDLADLAILRSKLAELGNLAILTLLADLADWKQIF